MKTRAEYSAIWRDSNREKYREAMRRGQQQYLNNPANAQKIKARRIANDALAAGRLNRQPCEVCGSTDSNMHHADYSQPLNVNWLCRRCHDVGTNNPINRGRKPKITNTSAALIHLLRAGDGVEG